MGTPGPAAKRHHYLPQFHLRGFADGETITTVELPGDRSYNQPVRKAASENHLYSLPGHPDGADVFEKALSQLEGDVASIFADIVSGTWPLSEESRDTLAYFVALQMARGPEQRRNMENLARQMTRMEIGYGGRAGVKGWAKKHLGIDADDATAARLWDEAMRPEGPPINISTAAHIEQTLELAESLHGYFSGRPWTLMQFDKRSLILSDVPVGLVRRDDDEDDWMGVGVLSAWGITFPLTRKLGLLMNDPTYLMDNDVPVEKTRAGKFDFRQAGTTAMEKLFNGQTAASASMRLFHHPDDARFVPGDLREPSPLTMSLQGTPKEYSGEPYILPHISNGRDDAPDSVED
jgi:hypothetical protein